MKKTLSYPELWKKKQRELPVKGNADTGWQKMRSMLDNQMPVTSIPKKYFKVKVPKWGLRILIGVSSVVTIYVGSRLYLSKQHDGPVHSNTPKIHRDSLPHAGSHISPALDAGKPFVETTGQRTSPVTPHTVHEFTDQSKLNSDTAQKRIPQPLDPIKAPAILNLPVRHDSVPMSLEAVPLKSRRDSIGSAGTEKKDVQKDTSTTVKKNLKKKKRSKFSIFF